MTSASHASKTAQCFQAVLCVLISVVLASSLTPIVPAAYAATADKPTSVMLQIDGDKNEIDVMKNVATLDSQKANTDIYLYVNDAYNNLSSSVKSREFVLVDANGKMVETLSKDTGNAGRFKIGKIKAGHKVVLITSTREANSTQFVKRYEQQLNIRVADTKSAESGTGNIAGISKDGGTWSFSNGLQYTFKNTGFKFLNDTTMTLGALRLPLVYKHNTDGTTIVGINCNPDDVAFYNAVKNGNVWQKYSSDKMAEMTKKMDKGFSGKKIGTWGGKAFDWSIMGFMEFNTKEPTAPYAVNLIISAGLKADGHAQYLIFTGTLTFTIGAKATLTGKLSPLRGPEGKFNLGAYAGLELYIGLGLSYLASVGAYGKGQIDIDFNILPETNLQSIMLSGDLGAKAKVFGFTVYTWSILSGKKPLYQRTSDTKKAPQLTQGEGGAQAGGPALNADGTATSPFTVSADTAYPMESSDYLNADNSLVFAQSDALSAQEATSSKTVLTGIYPEAEPVCVATSEGPVVVYVADARQIDQSSTRTDANRSVVAYKRMVNGTWSAARVIDTESSAKDTADYSPSVTADNEGNLYVSWLSANTAIENGATIGTVGNKLDVNVATITKGENIAADTIKVEKVGNESTTDGIMPASPKAVKVGDDLYVGWYTNQTTGSSGEVIGVNGDHKVRLYKRASENSWTSATTNEVDAGTGAITSFDVGKFGDTAACAWSFDANFESQQQEIELNGIQSLKSSEVYTLGTADTDKVLRAKNAANAQFAKRDGSDVLTYAVEITPSGADAVPYLSISSLIGPTDTGTVVLDGAKVNLPTLHYTITGDLNNNGNVSFLALADGSSDIQTLVTTGAGSDDWTAIVEATVEQAAVTNYCATYYPNGTPLFIYMTEPINEDGTIKTQADAGADMNQTTEDSLKHLNVVDVDYDEYAVKAGDTMPMTVYVENDGMLPVDGYKLWMLEGNTVKEMAASTDTVPLNLDDDDDEAAADDGVRTITFNYTVPTEDQITGKAHEFTVYAAPKNATVNESVIKHALTTESAMTCSLGAASLSLNADQQIIDGQESILATVTNDGIVSHAAQQLFVDGDTGDVLQSVDVPELAEAQTFSYTYAAPHEYFQNDGVKNIIVTLEEDGTENEGYEINNTEFISAWEVVVDENADPAASAVKAAPAKSVKTGDDLNVILIVVLALVALAVIAGSYVLYRRNRNK